MLLLDALFYKNSKVAQDTKENTVLQVCLFVCFFKFAVIGFVCKINICIKFH